MRRRARRGAPDGAGALVDLEHLGRDVRPREALGAPACRERHLGAPLRFERETPERLGQRLCVAARREHPVDAVAHDVAIAGDVRRDDRGAGGESLGEDHAEALPSERGRAKHVGAGELGGLALLGDLPERAHAAVVEQQRRDLLGPGPDQRERRRHVLAQRLEGAQQDRQPLALDGLADAEDAQLLRVGDRRRR